MRVHRQPGSTRLYAFLGVFLMALMLLFSSDGRTASARHIFVQCAPSSSTDLTATTFTVTNTNGSGPGSLGDAIESSNLQPGKDRIDFDIPGSGPHTIPSLNLLTDPVVIDGYSQPGAKKNTNPIDMPNNAVIQIETNIFFIRGGLTEVGGLKVGGIDIETGDCNHVAGNFVRGDLTIRNSDHNAIGSFGGSIFGDDIGAGNVIVGGIRISDGSDFNHVLRNFIGVDATGSSSFGALGPGVSISGESNHNIIGGSVKEERNVISGKVGSGVNIGVAAGINNNVVEGNFIGTDLTGTSPLGNSTWGIVSSGDGARIGGPSGSGNLVSSNGVGGILLMGNNNTVQGNLIGTDISGSTALGNNGVGLTVDGDANEIGGLTTDTRNVISGNHGGAFGTEPGAGVKVQGGRNVIRGNFVGTDISGSVGLGNETYGIAVAGHDNVIGGVTEGARNIISDNLGTGLEIIGTGNVAEGNYVGVDVTGTVVMGNESGALVNGDNNIIGGSTSVARNIFSGNNGRGLTLVGSGNQVRGNLIGLDASGGIALGNAGPGFLIQGNDNLIGGVAPLEGNIVSANGSTGLWIEGGASGNAIQGNFIGTDVTGTVALGNFASGMFIANSPGNIIGGSGAGDGNVISGNGGNGITISGGDGGNVVQGNHIGVDVNGDAILANHGDGVTIKDSPANVIGGTTSQSRNIISGNNNGGLTIDGELSINNQVQGNYIGTDATGAVGLGNSLAGVRIGSSNTLVGGTNPGEGNLISANTKEGIRIWDTNGAGVDNNIVQGNYIGTQADGISPLGNGSHGVNTRGSDNLIGGTTASAGNTIAFNNGAGVRVNNSSDSSRILRNAIFSNQDLGIDLGNRGPTPNDPDDPDTGPNNLQNFPEISSLGLDGGDLTITYKVPSTTGNAAYPLRVEFFIADSSNEEGKTFIGSDIYMAVEASVDKTITLLPETAVSIASVIVATATDADGNTSEFSRAVRLGLAGTFTVNSIDDNDDGLCNEAHCSLREAINAANLSPGPDTVEFEIPGNGPHTIQPLTSLPPLTDPVIIDGYTQSGASPNTNPMTMGSNAVLMIELDGSSAGTDVTGLSLDSGNSVLRGFVVNRFSVDGVRVGTGQSGNLLAGNFIGTDVTGKILLGNGRDGVRLTGASGNTIGGTTPEARNVISGHARNGILILTTVDASSEATSSDNFVQGNFIGIDVTGTVDLGNGESGVAVNGSPGNVIGGPVPGAGNVISGNDGEGIRINNSGATGNLVLGNFIGTDVTGTAGLGNTKDGVKIQDVPGNIVGGTTPEARNVISSNSRNGILIQFTGATGNIVQGNYIGTNVDGTIGLGNIDDGVEIRDAANNTVGGTAEGARNLISGNGVNGVRISEIGATGNVVQGNLIGTNVNGTTALGNFRGIRIEDGPNNIIGGAEAGARNIISGNTRASGVAIVGINATGNELRGNFIGTQVDGVGPLGNANRGVRIGETQTRGPASNNLLEDNTIAFNGADGVVVSQGTSNSIFSNSIFSNGGIGIDLEDDDVTLNDQGDADSGANDLQNFPVLVQVTTGSTNILGTLTSTPNTQFRLQFFSNNECDASNHGEGENFLHEITVTSDADGVAHFEVNLPVSVSAGQSVTATATDPNGSTSEFSRCVRAGDEDGDGIGDDVEDGAPNGGDGNSDGVFDSQQGNVASLPNTVNEEYVTFVSPDGTGLSNVRAIGNPSPVDAPVGVEFPIGFFDFHVQGVSPGGAVTITVLLPPSTTVSTYYKFGPTPDNVDPHWYEFLYDGTTGAQWDPKTITLTLNFQDGLRGDNDLTINGEILEPGGPGIIAGPIEAHSSFSLHQNPNDGATGFKVEVTRVTEAVTGSEVSVSLAEFQSSLSYDGSCVNILDVRELDFPLTDVSINDPAGLTTFNGAAPEGMLAPVDLGHGLTSLIGNNQVACDVTMGITSLTDKDGGSVAVIPTQLSHTVQRGDARADGNITIADALFIAQYLVGLRDACTVEVAANCLHSVNAASVRHDGAFDKKTIADALFIAQYLVGLRDEFYNLVP